MQTHAVMIKEDGIPIRIAIVQVIPGHQFTLGASEGTIDNDQRTSAAASSAKTPTKDATQGNRKEKQVEENVVSRTARHIDTPEGIRYVIRWYCYRLLDIATEPVTHVPQHFSQSNWRHLQSDSNNLDTRRSLIKKGDPKRGIKSNGTEGGNRFYRTGKV